MGRKSTKVEAAFKVKEIYGRITKGQSRTKILQQCTEKWQCSERQVETYYARAQKLIIDDCEMSRTALLAELIAGVRDTRESADKAGQHQVSLNAIRLLSELTGLNKD